MRTVSTTDLPEIFDFHADLQINHGSTITPLIIGDPGLGKSAIAKEWSDTSGYQFFDCRLGNMLPSDIRLPYVDKEAGTARFFVTEEIPCHMPHDGKYALMLDEILQCGPLMQKVGMQITHDRSVGGKALPPQTLVMAAGNGAESKSHFEKFGNAQLNRFEVYHMLRDLDSWLNYHTTSGFCPLLVAFIKSNSAVPYDYDPAKTTGEENFPTFRSLTEVGNFINYYTDDKGNFKPGRLFNTQVEGAIGSKGAEAFIAFLTIWQSIGSIEDLIKDPEGAVIPNDLATKMVIACKLAGEATKENIEAISIITARMSPEDGLQSFYSAFIVKTVAATKKDMMLVPAFTNMASKVLVSIM